VWSCRAAVSCIAAWALASCNPAAPRGFLGVDLGAEVQAAARRLGLTCAAAAPGAHATCAAPAGHRRPVFGRPAEVILVHRDQRVAGIVSRFAACDQAAYVALQADVAREFGVDVRAGEPAAPDRVWADGTRVRFARVSSPEACILTVADRRYGEAVTWAGLREALDEIGSSLQPH
jgi:hypothetical protein